MNKVIDITYDMHSTHFDPEELKKVISNEFNKRTTLSQLSGCN